MKTRHLLIHWLYSFLRCGYGAIVPWEIPVQMCLKDFLRHGDCALDIGANIGGLSIAMSRMVGPSGQVHAFEANPFMLPRLKRDLEINGASNVHIVSCAAWSSSGVRLPFYCDDSYYASASTLMSEARTGPQVIVETISVDDYCARTRIAPRAIKLDVEGAEYRILCGAEHTLETLAPVIVLEYYPADATERDSLTFLGKRGYVCFDVNLYERVDREFYLTHFSPLRTVNVLALPPSLSDKYAMIRLIPISTLDLPNGCLTTELLELPTSGRYQVTVEFDGPPQAEAALIVFTADGTQLAYFQAPLLNLRQHSASSLIIEANALVQIRVRLKPIQGKGSDMSLRQVRVSSITR